MDIPHIPNLENPDHVVQEICTDKFFSMKLVSGKNIGCSDLLLVHSTLSFADVFIHQI